MNMIRETSNISLVSVHYLSRVDAIEQGRINIGLPEAFSAISTYERMLVTSLVVNTPPVSPGSTLRGTAELP